MSRSITSFRIVSLVEGLSYLVLVFIAMPLKYVWNEPGAVKVFGQAHGVLFIAFVAALVWVTQTSSISLGDRIKLFVLSLIPFGFLVIDKHAKRLSATEASRAVARQERGRLRSSQ